MRPHPRSLADSVGATTAEVRPEGRSSHRRLAAAALGSLAILSGLLSWTAVPAPAASRSVTDVFWHLVDDSGRCVWKAAFLEVGLGRGGGYNFEVLVINECTDKVVMVGDTVETQLQPGDVVVSRDLSRATVNLSSPVVDRYTGAGVIGTLTTSQSLTFTKSKIGAGGSYDARICIPLDVDPETAEPLPGTRYMKERLLGAGGSATTTLLRASGSLEVTLANGRSVEFMTPEAEARGWVTARHGTVVHRVTGPMDECTERFRN